MVKLPPLHLPSSLTSSSTSVFQLQNSSTLFSYRPCPAISLLLRHCHPNEPFLVFLLFYSKALKLGYTYEGMYGIYISRYNFITVPSFYLKISEFCFFLCEPPHFSYTFVLCWICRLLPFPSDCEESNSEVLGQVCVQMV